MTHINWVTTPTEHLGRVEQLQEFPSSLSFICGKSTVGVFHAQQLQGGDRNLSGVLQVSRSPEIPNWFEKNIIHTSHSWLSAPTRTSQTVKILA